MEEVRVFNAGWKCKGVDRDSRAPKPSSDGSAEPLDLPIAVTEIEMTMNGSCCWAMVAKVQQKRAHRPRQAWPSWTCSW